MIIAYGKLGRAVTFNESKWGAVGGDNEAKALLLSLHDVYPEAKFLLLSRCTDGPKDIPPYVINPWPGFKHIPYGRNLMDKEGLTVEECANRQQESVDDAYDRLFRPYAEAGRGDENEIVGSVIWLGQHGTTSNRTLMTDGSGGFTLPLDSHGLYSAPIVQFVNGWEAGEGEVPRDTVWLCPDVRNALKTRDVHRVLRMPILGQWDMFRPQRQQMPARPLPGWETSKLVQCSHQYIYSGLELCGVPMPTVEPDASAESRPVKFGIIVNETRSDLFTDRSRLFGMRDYVLPLLDENSFIHGTWSVYSAKRLREEAAGTPARYACDKITPVRYEDVMPFYERSRYTISFCGSGIGWATAKPWECFSRGVLHFFHPFYDEQFHVLPKEESAPNWTVHAAALNNWLRVKDPEQLARRVEHLEENPTVREWLVREQWQHFVECWHRKQILHHISDRIPVEPIL